MGNPRKAWVDACIDGRLATADLISTYYLNPVKPSIGPTENSRNKFAISGIIYEKSEGLDDQT